MSWAFAETRYTDNSINADLSSSGDLSQGANRNVIAGGNVTYTGLTDELAKQVIEAVQGAYNGATNFVQSAIGQADNRTQSQVEFVASSLKEAYSSEKNTLESLKSYAVYGLLAFVAWAYFRK